MKKSNLSSVLHVRRKDLVPTLARLAFSSVSSATATSLLASLETGNFEAVVSSQINPSTYRDASEFRKDYFLVESFSKYPFWDLKIDRQKVALTKFIAAEQSCKETNIRLARLENFSWDVTSIFVMARQKINQLLGPMNWDECSMYFGFGPGGTTRVKKKHADPYHKFTGIPESTENAALLSEVALRFYKLWGEPIAFQTKLVEGNRVVTVPKNAKTDRVIASEPCMNIFLQKGIGGVIRKRLKRVGVNLDDQSLNQELARQGSIDGLLATVDLSSASDTISKELVRHLLPEDWFDAMASCRSETGVLPDGSRVRYQKVSSMGNGFTFELESLIFWALADATRFHVGEKDRRMAVYGDDIIVPVGMYSMLKEILEFAGFSVNSKKTHASGPFRESCGKHFFSGVDVTPIYFKDKVDSYPRYIWACNQLKRWSHNGVFGLDPIFRPLWDEIHNRMKGFWSRPHIPDGMGDGALIGDFDEVRPQCAPRGFQGWRVTHFEQVRETFRPEGHSALLKSLWFLGRKPDARDGRRTVTLEQAKASLCVSILDVQSFEGRSKRSYLPVPTEKLGWKVSSSTVWQWPTLGGWLDQDDKS
jgi:hypothetical protein